MNNLNGDSEVFITSTPSSKNSWVEVMYKDVVAKGYHLDEAMGLLNREVKNTKSAEDAKNVSWSEE